MKVGYVRVSTVEQNEERQVLAMKEHGVDKVFVDKASGKNTKREKLDEMLSFVREGDVLYVSEFSRLANSSRRRASTSYRLRRTSTQRPRREG